MFLITKINSRFKTADRAPRALRRKPFSVFEYPECLNSLLQHPKPLRYITKVISGYLK
jgi:hypothetical protein